MSMAALPPVPDADMFRRELLHVTRSLQTIVHAGVMPICQRHALTAQQMYVLVELLDEPGQSAGQLSDRAGILRTNFSAVCHKLEERGWWNVVAARGTSAPSSCASPMRAVPC